MLKFILSNMQIFMLIDDQALELVDLGENDKDHINYYTNDQGLELILIDNDERTKKVYINRVK